MIRVLQCVSNMDRAGIETMLMNYYRNIDRNKIQFYFLCNKTKPGAYDEEIKNYGGKLLYSPGLNPIHAIKYHKYVKKIIKDNNIDIVHVHNGAFGLQALIAAKSCGVKVRISHAHGTRIDINYKLPLKLIYKSRLKKYANNYWGCGMEAIEYYYGKKVVEEGQYYLLKNAIDETKFKYNKTYRNQIRKKLNISDDEILIGHIGRFMAQKNHKFLIDLFNELLKYNNKFKLVLIGDGELLQEFKNRVNLLNIENNVIFTGNIANTNEYYSAFDLFLLPSLFEGLPVVGIEAQASGLNCIFSDTISKEVDLTGNTSFISLDSPVSIWCNKIIELSNKPRNMISNQIETGGYSIKKEVKELENKYKSLLK